MGAAKPMRSSEFGAGTALLIMCGCHVYLSNREPWRVPLALLRKPRIHVEYHGGLACSRPLASAVLAAVILLLVAVLPRRDARRTL
jgi:hypothetical protein